MKRVPADRKPRGNREAQLLRSGAQRSVVQCNVCNVNATVASVIHGMADVAKRYE